MVQKMTTFLVDDLTGRELADGAGETVHFGIDGANYEIDLDRRTADQLRAILDRHAHAGRRAGAPSRPAPRRIATLPSPSAVRAWAAANRITLSNRGRIPASVIEQFRAAGHE